MSNHCEVKKYKRYYKCRRCKQVYVDGELETIWGVVAEDHSEGELLTSYHICHPGIIGVSDLNGFRAEDAKYNY